jgi:predicted ATPase
MPPEWSTRTTPENPASCAIESSASSNGCIPPTIGRGEYEPHHGKLVAILAEQRSVGAAGTPDRDPSLFVDLLLRRSIDKHEAAQHWEGSALFDRGVPDCIAYAALMGIDPTPSILASEAYRYHNEVLVLEPWEEIYTVDEERTMSFAATLPFQRALVDAYERAGYVLVEVPRNSVENRAVFVREFITRR